MKQKGKIIFLVACMLLGSITGAAAASASGRYGGNDGKSIDYEWFTGWNIQGDYTMAIATNRSDSPAYMKQVYARSGEEGSYSEWAPSGKHYISCKDFGPYGTDEYDADFYWDYD